MRKMLVIAVSLTILLGALYAHFFYSAETDELVIALRDDSFLPIKPPSNLHVVGAIYYIEPDLGTVTKLCQPTPDISKKYMHDSASADASGARTYQGTYVSTIKANSDQKVGGKSSVDDQRSIKVHYQLTNVRIYEIPVASSKDLYDQLMNTKNCSDVVKNYLNLPGYICQDLQLLKASVLFKSDSETDTGANLDSDSQKALGAEIEAKLGVRVTDNEGRSTSGEGLQWGIQMAIVHNSTLGTVPTHASSE